MQAQGVKVPAQKALSLLTSGSDAAALLFAQQQQARQQLFHDVSCTSVSVSHPNLLLFKFAHTDLVCFLCRSVICCALPPCWAVADDRQLHTAV
jgi:hypothetical protein